MKTRLKTTRLFTLVVLFSFSAIAPATEKPKNQEGGEIESILDRLEQRLMDLENNYLTFEERQGATSNKEEHPSSIYRYKTSTIQGDLKEKKQLRKLASAITKLETDVNNLASEIQKTKHRLLEHSSIDNTIHLEANLKGFENAALNSLVVRLDGFELYHLKETSGLWLPNNILPLYFGPLQPGKHHIDIQAKISLKYQENLRLNNDIYKLVNERFTINIPTKTNGLRYAIEISPPKKLSGTASISLKKKNIGM